MSWSSIREFLRIPEELTGKGVGIAIVDGSFPNHPDIATNVRRNSYLVKTSEPDPHPTLHVANDGPWNRGLHGLWTAAAAAGSGYLSDERYAGAAPDADLYLLETGRFNTIEEIEHKFEAALSWLILNWRQYNIRGVVLTIASTRDTGLLPWQADPIRIRCEQLSVDGLLVIVASGNTMELTCSGPASSPSVLSVGGVIISEDAAINQARPYHGCRGNTFEGKWIPEILAPAENLVLPMPFQTLEERRSHYTASNDNLPEGYARTEGTSFAGPIILGCAACIWQAQPNWTANQVKAAMISSSIRNEMWDELYAGLVDVAGAVEAVPPIENSYKPYCEWKDWQSKDQSTRIEAMQDQDEALITSVLLSFCGELFSDEVAEQLLSLSNHKSHKVRTAAITALGFHSGKLSSSALRRLLCDDSSYVRMAALFALNNCPEMWQGLTDEIIKLFQDPDVNLRYCSIKLASAINNHGFIEPLISGLYEDALLQRVSLFGARCNALEAITGIAFDPMPEWRDGQCFYSDRSKQARLHIAQKWAQWKVVH
ncbi:S8 family serine peptidase [Paenibacillus sp. CF384]|uniref:S8 family serine peptidase n=1 Tax=Paenibacillus sp. CF384 TaxID=1884382 RepID=UPI0008994BCA|nr:S8 family serine peptidase [Paenibacillus sp. CF384]SDX04796.1 serine protease AprX [Paenibacillus sp. CF384]